MYYLIAAITSIIKRNAIQKQKKMQDNLTNLRLKGGNVIF